MNQGLLAALVMYIISIALFFVGRYQLSLNKRLEEEGIKTIAKIIRITRQDASESGTRHGHYTIEVAFKDLRKKEYEAILPYAPSEKEITKLGYSEGDKIEIKYLPNKPEKITSEFCESSSIIPALLIGAAIIVFLCGTFVLYQGILNPEDMQL